MSLTNILIAIIFFLSFYSVLELIKRKFKPHTELTRKIAHLFSGVAAIFFSYFLNVNEFILVSLMFLGLFLLTRSKRVFKSIIPDHRKTYGEILYPLGLIVLALSLYQFKELFITGVLILAIPDTVAGYLGFKLNKKTKSKAGSLAYFLITLAILLIGFNLKTSVLLAAILTLVEFISPLGIDNLSVPFAFCLLAYLFNLR